jgi:carboxyl-terminal processing protease
MLLHFAGGITVLAQKRQLVRKGSVKATVLTPGQSTPEALRRYEAFNKVWTTLQQNYFDPTFNKLDWNKIRTEFEPRVRDAKTDAAVHKLIEEMIGRLGRSHLAIIPPEVYRVIESAKIEAKFREAERAEHKAARAANGEAAAEKEPYNFDDPLTQYGIGVDLRIIDNSFVIFRMEPDSAATHAGMKTGYVIEKVNGVSLSDLLARMDILGARSSQVKRYLPSQIISGFLNGEKDSKVFINFIDEKGESKEVSIRRERLQSKVISLMTGMPERHLVFEKRVLPGDVGYIRFDHFVVPAIDKFCEAIGEFRGKKGLIIDLRGNFGGLIATMTAFGGMLNDRDLDLGTSMYRTGNEKLTASPKAKRFNGNVVFLVDNQSISAAEIFAASMQDGKRAFVVGVPTAGEALPSVAVELPTGAVLQYPIANYKTGSGRLLEGNGVTPDFLVPLTRKELLQGRDEQIEKALELIRDGKIPVRQEPAPDYTGPVKNTGVVPLPPTAIRGDAGPPPPPRKPIPRNSDGQITESSDSIKDPAATRIIDDFLSKIGGADKIGAIDKYELRGETELSVKGARNVFEINIFRDGPGKYSEIMQSPSAGEIREMHNGKTLILQTDYGMTREMPKFVDIVETDILSPIRSLTKPAFFVSLKYQGVFARGERKVHLIDGKSKDGMLVALAFDSDTGLLVNFTGAYYGVSFDDYRKTGDLLLPYEIERERIMTITLDEVKINQAIDPANFIRKEKCFDREN